MTISSKIKAPINLYETDRTCNFIASKVSVLMPDSPSIERYHLDRVFGCGRVIKFIANVIVCLRRIIMKR